MMHTIGYIPHSVGLVKNISVLDNILIGALPRLNRIQSILKQFPEHEIQEAKRILKLVGLSGKESRKAYMLSGGEKRRVAIARALMQKSTILLADQIVSELDNVTSREIMNLVLEAHKKMRRKSGEPYILHPISVAQICVQEIGLGATSIIAALLHDVVEDTDLTLKFIEKKFGYNVARICDGLIKISGVFTPGSSIQSENFKKMLLTLVDDMRVILIKLADRLHNMRTLESMSR